MTYPITVKSFSGYLTLLLLIILFLPLQSVSSSPCEQEIVITTINQEAISVSDFQERIRFSYWSSTLFIREVYEQGDLGVEQIETIYAPLLELLRNPDLHAEHILNQMEHELVIKHAADARGITVEQVAIDNLIQNEIALRPSFKSVDDFYRRAAKEAETDRETIYGIYSYEALEQALFEDVTADIPVEEPQVHVRHILLAFNPDDPYDRDSISEQQRLDAFTRAEDVLKALGNGETFSELALSLSDDKWSAPNGGDIPWAGESTFPISFWEAVKDAPAGSIIGPIETEFGYHVVEILERGLHPRDPRVLMEQKQERFSSWLESETARVEIQRNPDWRQYIPIAPPDELFPETVA